MCVIFELALLLVSNASAASADSLMNMVVGRGEKAKGGKGYENRSDVMSPLPAG